jgi:Glycosyltransferase family 87
MTALSARLSAGVPAGVRDFLADPARRRLILVALSAVGYGIGLAALLATVANDGGYGYDSQAYWLAGQNVLHGQPLYGDVAVDAFGAYKYPPVFAQLIAPLTLIPALAFSWLWRIACFLCVRWLAGSWRNVGLWLLVPLTITELSLGNITFMVAAATVLALRGQGWLTAPMAALKFGPIFVAPYLWLVKPEQRRSLLIGALGFAGLCAVSFAFNPTAWTDYIDSLLRSTTTEMVGQGVIAIWPTGAVDLALRLAIAGALTAVAIRRRSERWVFTATVIAVPILALSRLAPMLVLPRLGRTPTDAAGEPERAAATA